MRPGGPTTRPRAPTNCTRSLPDLPTNLIMRHEVTEISVAFVALGALLVALAILLGQAWRPLP